MKTMFIILSADKQHIYCCNLASIKTQFLHLFSNTSQTNEHRPSSFFRLGKTENWVALMSKYKLIKRFFFCAKTFVAFFIWLLWHTFLRRSGKDISITEYFFQVSAGFFHPTFFWLKIEWKILCFSRFNFANIGFWRYSFLCSLFRAERLRKGSTH